MLLRSLAPLLFAGLPAFAAKHFVTTEGGQFVVNGSEFRFLGTTAYWLSALNSDEDIYAALSNMSANGIKVVRTWAFNDVNEIPKDNSTWFQHIAPNGVVTINEGANGLKKLDTIVAAAEKLGLYIHFSLTNNWNPATNATSSTKARPRNSLSNAYGGMDAYIRANLAADSQHHDLFYTDDKIQDLFQKYTTKIVSRYKDSHAIFAWEVANDARCNSTLPDTGDCTPHTVTRWHSKVAKHIKKVDPNHLVSSGSHGFFCVDCTKLFPRTTSPPPARPSARAAPRAAKRKVLPLTRARLISEKKRAFRVASETSRSGMSGFSIRGRWSAPVSRQKSDFDLGNAFNGVHGVDSEDLLNIPEVGFGTFQLFPDQNEYDSATISTDAFNKTVEQGVNWIQRNGDAGLLYGKPVALTGFGLVTQDNAPSFVPFNSSLPFLSTSTFNSTSTNTSTPTNSTYGVTNEQRDRAYGTWVNATIQHDVSGAIQYQWGQSNLTPREGSAITSNQDTTGTTDNVDSTGITPNDGYSQEIGTTESQSFFNTASQEIGTTA